MVCGRRGKRGAPVGKGKGPWRRKLFMDVFIYLFIFLGGGREDEDNTMVKLGFFFLSNCLFWGIYLKKSIHSFFGAWSILLVHIWFIPSEGPKGFVN